MIKTLYLIALGATNLSLLNPVGLFLIETIELTWFLSFDDALNRPPPSWTATFLATVIKPPTLDL